MTQYKLTLLFEFRTKKKMTNAGNDTVNAVYISLWEFKVHLNEHAIIMLKNIATLNLICTAFADCQYQAVIKISVCDLEKDCAKVILLVNGELAEKNLLKNFSFGKIENELNQSLYCLSSEAIVTSLSICQVGYILDVSKSDFDDMLSDVRNSLNSPTDDLNCSQILFTSSPILYNFSKIFIAPVNWKAEKLVNGVLRRSLSSTANSSSLSSKSSLDKYESVMNYVSHYHLIHGDQSHGRIFDDTWSRNEGNITRNFGFSENTNTIRSRMQLHSADGFCSPKVDAETGSSVDSLMVSNHSVRESDDDSDSFHDCFSECLQERLASLSEIDSVQRNDSLPDVGQFSIDEKSESVRVELGATNDVDEVCVNDDCDVSEIDSVVFALIDRLVDNVAKANTAKQADSGANAES